MRHARTLPDTPDSRLARETAIARFVARWAETPSLMAMGPGPAGRGGAADIEALDYVIYENLYSLFFADRKAFVAGATAIFGNCLAHLLHFEWCCVELPSGTVTGLKHPQLDIVLPLEALIVAKLSGLPQYGGFESLFFDIYSMSYFWGPGHHFLEESQLNLEEGAFESRWGFVVPDRVRDGYAAFCAVDNPLAARLLGLAAYDWEGIPDWTRIVDAMSEVNRQFVDRFGADWASRSEA
jgi:hypothetical protein